MTTCISIPWQLIISQLEMRLSNTRATLRQELTTMLLHFPVTFKWNNKNQKYAQHIYLSSVLSNSNSDLSELKNLFKNLVDRVLALLYLDDRVWHLYLDDRVWHLYCTLMNELAFVPWWPSPDTCTLMTELSLVPWGLSPDTCTLMTELALVPWWRSPGTCRCTQIGWSWHPQPVIGLQVFSCTDIHKQGLGLGTSLFY